MPVEGWVGGARAREPRATVLLGRRDLQRQVKNAD